ncbi:GerMN domain-containing protein [Alkaliphilus serpentinus]|uniref:GerMN domain-containing protein n=1 Tax=Alkaliphilus serpentinus TaxID=1482731 RepID=A0A833HRB8_9FIRM|nr:GerMN domain-containing protein [Alkaliphilus serpentinus]KAB3532884.1 GerMN domain-containing protein [Alkaliphilus serpentinus]
MFRSIRNIILVLIICLTASGLPLYADSIDFQAFIPKVEEINLEFSSEVEVLSEKESKITFSIATDGGPTTVALNPDAPLAVSLIVQDEASRIIDLQNILDTHLLDEITVSKDSPLNIHLTLNQEKLNLPDGDYKIHIEANIMDYQLDHNTALVNISFLNEYTYIPAARGINRSQSALTLFFPDSEHNHIIPITRILPYTSTPLRATIDNLIKGPDESLNLANEFLIPNEISVSLNKDIAGVNFYGDLSQYEGYPSNSYFLVKVLVESLGSIKEVNSVQFYFKNRIVDAALHDQSMRDPYTPSTEVKTYTALVTDSNRLLLTPLNLSNDKTPQGLFNSLKYSGAMEVYNAKLMPPVPEEINLENYTLVDGNLTLEFNSAFLEAYNKDVDRQLMMIDAILFSFSSLDDVNTVEIKVNGKIIEELHGVEIPSNVDGLYINPEMDYRE